MLLVPTRLLCRSGSALLGRKSKHMPGLRVRAQSSQKKALILRSLLNLTPICVLSEIIAIIFDTGVSSRLTPFLSDFKGKITPCFVKLQGIGSGLIAKGKGTIEYNFVGKDGKMVTIEASVLDTGFEISDIFTAIVLQA